MSGFYDPITGKLVRVVSDDALFLDDETLAGLIQDIVPPGFDENTMVRTSANAFAVSPALIVRQERHNISIAKSMFATADVDLGYPSRRSGRFSIEAERLTLGKPVTLWLAPGPYFGKGWANSYDEVQMYDINATGRVKSSDEIECWWNSPHRVGGYIKFNFQIGE